MAEQPEGLVVLTVVLRRSEGTKTDWWQCSAHQSGSRTTFWERGFHVRGGKMTELFNRTTDEIWDAAMADAWLLSQVRGKLVGGFTLVQEQSEVPDGPLADLLSNPKVVK